MPTIATMRLLGGRPSLDLVNTVDVRRDGWGPDLLQHYQDLVAWAVRVGVTSDQEAGEALAAAAADPMEAQAALGRAKQLREAVAAVAEALIGGEPPPKVAAHLVGEAVDDARRHQRLLVSGLDLTWDWSDEPALDRIAHRVALDAAALLTDDRARRRLKLCPGPRCGWLYLDETKNGNRRWCRDAGCGARARALRYRTARP